MSQRVVTRVTLTALFAGFIACNGTDVVSTVPVASVSLSVPRTSLRVGETLQAAALPLDASGGVLTGRTITWSSSDPTVASVSSAGMITAVSPGSATISAEVEGKTGTATLVLSLVPVASVTIVPGTQTVSAGTTAPLTVVLKDSADRVITGRTIVWTSSNPATATVSETGMVTGILVGTTDIKAAVEGKEAHAQVTVNTATTPAATLTVTPGNTAMSGGATKQLIAVLKDANGNVIDGRTITWVSSNPDRATVSSTGLVTASAVDASVVITATAEGKTATSSIDIHTFVLMSAGSGFSCGVTADGTAYCWGVNNSGQLGDGTTTNRLTPTRVSTDVKLLTISSGGSTSCGIAQDGFTYCWGLNDRGELGRGTSGGTSASPAQIFGGYKFVSVATSQTGACATTADLDVYCWGSSYYDTDRLDGDGPFSRIQAVPLKIGTGMVAVVAGVAPPDPAVGTAPGYCSVDPTGTAYCWLLRFTYIYETGLTTPPIRQAVSTSLHFTTVRVGYGHACGLVASGQAYCWGRNDFGQLGDGTRSNRVDPTPVAGGLSFESLAAGGATVFDSNADSSFVGGYSCGLTSEGKAYCWGSNISGQVTQGQLGIGSQEQFVLTPRAVAGGASFTGLRAGASQTCGLAIGGAAYCWGSNANGQLGDGTTTSALKPSPVFGQ